MCPMNILEEKLNWMYKTNKAAREVRCCLLRCGRENWYEKIIGFFKEL